MKLIRTFISVFYLLVIWCLYFASQYFLVEKSLENLNHLPDNVTFAMRIDGSSVLKSTIFSSILEANDPELVDVINFQINEKRKRKGPKTSMGIDYLSDILFYTAPFEDGQVLGVNYNLKRPDLMRKNSKVALGKNQVFVINDHFGVVLSYVGKTSLHSTERSKLLKLAKKIAFSPLKSELAEKIKESNANQLLRFTSEGQLFGETTLFNRSNVSVSLGDHALEINGELIKNRFAQPIFTLPKMNLIPSALHFYTTLIPEKVQDSLHKLFLIKNLELPKIESISLNFRGSSIHNSDQGLIYSPDMDLYLTFQNETNLKSLLEKSGILQEYKFTWVWDVIDNGQQKYYVRKIDSKSYVISTNKDIKLAANNGNTLLSLSGNLNAITEIKGDKMILFFLENLPIFKSSKDFFARTKGVNIEIKNSKENKALLKGSFQFKNEYYPMNEFLKFAIQNNFIRVK